MGNMITNEKQTAIEKIASEAFNTRDVVKKLENIMDRVTSKECTAETVNAACNAAGRITDILRVHLEVMKLTRRN